MKAEAKRTKLKMPPKPRFVAIKILLGLVLFAAGAYSIEEYISFESTAVHGTGVIRDLERHVHRTGRRGGAIATVRPLIEFTPRGYDHAIKARTSQEERDTYNLGEEVGVEYQPNLPERSLRIDSGIPALDFILMLVGAGLVGSVAWAHWQRRSVQRALAAT